MLFQWCKSAGFNSTASQNGWERLFLSGPPNIFRDGHRYFSATFLLTCPETGREPKPKPGNLAAFLSPDGSGSGLMAMAPSQEDDCEVQALKCLASLYVFNKRN